jgi:hypothetical protein
MCFLSFCVFWCVSAVLNMLLHVRKNLCFVIFLVMKSDLMGSFGKKLFINLIIQYTSLITY